MPHRCQSPKQNRLVDACRREKAEEDAEDNGGNYSQTQRRPAENGKELTDYGEIDLEVPRRRVAEIHAAAVNPFVVQLDIVHHEARWNC